MADNGSFFLDTAPPFITADVTSVTLAATNKALYPASAVKAMGRDYWWVGKKVLVEIFGRITTAATPGNLTLALFYGTGADANGTSLAATAATALTASQTNLSFFASWNVHCRAIGTSGSLFATGRAKFNEAVIAAGMLMPASAPAATTVDLTVAGQILSVQALRSGSTAETMQIHDIIITARN